MIIVSDATAVTTLIKCHRARLLQQLFGTICVPQAVAHELLAFHPKLPGFVSVTQIGRPEEPLPGVGPLGRGEAEAIRLARELGAQLLLTDDRKARSVAESLGIPCLGLLGLLIKAKRIGLIDSVRQSIELLQNQGGLYLSDEVKSEALKLAQEQS